MILAVAGMVGAGKSTLTSVLAQTLGLRNIPESVGVANPWLDLFYAADRGDGQYNPYALPLDLHFLTARLETMRAVGAEQGCVVDRTWYEDAEVFAKRRFDTKRMDANEYDLYKRIYAELLHAPAAQPPAAIVYLDAPLDVILSRIHERGRLSEQRMPESYWADLYMRYHVWLEAFKACPIIRIDVRDYDIKSNPDDVRLITSRLMSSIASAGEKSGQI